MTREELQRASDELRQAAEATTGEARERLYDQSNQFADLATVDRGPDHGRLARHENVLNELKAEVDETARSHIETAEEHVRAYRETVEGV